jgi:hypothetical protein
MWSVLLALAAVCAGNSWAASIAVLNPSFELPALPAPPPASNGVPQNWAVGGAAGDHYVGAGEFNPGFPTDGVQVGWANLGGSLSQVLATNLTAGTPYLLRVDIGRRMDFNADASGGYIQLIAGATNLGLLLLDGAQPAPGNWAQYDLYYTSPYGDPLAGQPLQIVLGSNTTQTGFDNVRLDIVPEPAAVTLGVIGFMGLIAWRRRSVMTK